jgi:hypothetical protein
VARAAVTIELRRAAIETQQSKSYRRKRGPARLLARLFIRGNRQFAAGNACSFELNAQVLIRIFG